MIPSRAGVSRTQAAIGLLLLAATMLVALQAVPAAALTLDECVGSFECDASETIRPNPDDNGQSNVVPCQCCRASPAGGSALICRNASSLCPGGMQATCARCDSTGACLACLNGYSVVNGMCQVCTATNCLECMQGNGRQCNVCRQGYDWVSESSCVQQPIGTAGVCGVGYCDTCKSGFTTLCERCAIWFTITTTGTCVSQCSVPNCQVCAPGVREECSLCFSGYTPSANGAQCNADTTGTGCRVAHCSQCDPNDRSRCLTCATSYHLDTNDGLCKSCLAPYCKTCKAGTTSKCAVCGKGYSLNSTEDCVRNPCAVTGCVACRAGNPNWCEDCGEPNAAPPADGQCVTTTAAPPTRTTSPSTQAPQRCTVANCAACVSDNPNRCQTCATGYTLNAAGGCGRTGACNVLNCLRCRAGDASKCQQCRNGYGITTAATCVRGFTSGGRNVAGMPPQALLVAALAMATTAFLAMV